MAQQTLRTVISIGGRVDNSFGALGDSMLVLGSQIDALSQKAINFGKESLMTYASYDDAMREAQAAGKFTAQEMERLDRLNRQIAQTTIYSNTEAASAMAELVKRGYDLHEVEEMLPSVLNLAMAGNLELADSVTYLGSTLKALGEDADYADILVDMMARASDISAADINTLGDAITRLGSGIDMFRGGAEEALTLMTLLSDYGEDMQGTQGGTMLRNFALSLIAPAGQNAEVLAALDNFGMSSEELAAYMEEEEITATAAAAAIDGLGLKVFDADGKLRNMHDILIDLDKALMGLPDEERIPVLRSIFGKRGYTTAENLLKSLPDYLATYSEILNSAGAADERAAIMQGGIGGEIREFTAAYEELKTSLGEQLAPEAEAVIGWAGDFITDISNLDETKLAALVGAGEGLAAIGPGLLLAGSGIRLAGSAVNLFGGKGAAAAGVLMLTAVGVGAAVSALEKAQELDFEGNFGLMEIDQQAINESLGGIKAALDEQTREYDEYRAAVEGAVAAYETASATLSKDLLSAAITGATLTEPDKQRLLGLGNEMYTQLVAGITNSSAASVEYYQLLFGGDAAAKNDPAYQELFTLLESSYNDALAQAESLSQKLRDAMTDAFEDGKITPDEYREILGIYDSINEAMVRAEGEAASKQEEIDRRMLLHKAQHASWDSAEATLNEITSERAAVLAEEDERFWKEYYSAQVEREYAIARGEEYSGESLDALYNRYFGENGRRAGISGQYDEHASALVHALLGTSDYAGTLDFLATTYGTGVDADRFLWNTDNIRHEEGLRELTRGADKLIRTLRPFESDSGIAHWIELLEYGIELYGTLVSQPAISESLQGDGILYDPWTNAPIEPGFDLPGPEYFGLEPTAKSKYALPPLTATVEMPDGGKLAQELLDDAQAAANADPVTAYVDFYPRKHQLNLPGLDTFAEGGRATEASIFGEAGAEWAIPEEYSQNTADLLDAARRASGFSWPDLISRTSGGGNKTTQLVYSPTIYAMDARDVEQKLAEDKERLKRFLEERALRDEIEVYR